MNIEEQWDYETFIKHIRDIRDRYEETYMGFNIYDVTEFGKRIAYRRRTKNAIYSLPYDRECKDNIWLYLHREIGIETLKNVKNKKIYKKYIDIKLSL